MKKLILQWLEKIACHHKWEVHRIVDVYDRDHPESTRPFTCIETLICKKCGKIKKIDVT